MSPPHDESPTAPHVEADPKGGLTRRAVVVGGVVGGAGILSAEIFAAEPAAAYSFGTNFVAPPGYCQPFTTPVPPIGSYYQEYRTCACTSPHVGTDYTGPMAKDRTICSIGPGQVSNKAYNSGMGNFIRIQHPNGVSSQYLHLKSPSPLAIGDPVFAGTAIGVVGMTGNAYAPHLHLETYYGGNLISPEVYLSQSPPAGENPPQIHSEGRQMEAIVSVPSGVVVHLRTGGKTHFGSVDEYNNFRNQVNTLRAHGATDIMPLPELSQVVGVSWDTFAYLCAYIGAPAN